MGRQITKDFDWRLRDSRRKSCMVFVISVDVGFAKVEIYEAGAERIDLMTSLNVNLDMVSCMCPLVKQYVYTGYISYLGLFKQNKKSQY